MFGAAARVAVVATLAVAVLYVVLVALLVTVVSHRLTHETDVRLAGQLSAVSHQGLPLQPIMPRQGDADDAPLYLWHVSRAGSVLAASAGAPPMTQRQLTAGRNASHTVAFGGSHFRMAAVELPDGSRVIAAESLAQENRVHDLLVVTALLVSPVLVGGVFVSAFLIGHQASRPVEQARRRQLEFTADASHELRTPLTVIDAEVGLALSSQRSAGAYRESLHRVSGETQRLRRIVEDLLWLARFDAEPPAPAAELVDVDALVEQCVHRFAPLIETRGIDLQIHSAGDSGAQIAAPPEWIDRLVGVLLDNALRYAGTGGRVDVDVAATSTHVVMSVSDSGPGMPPNEWAHLFDRFHRADIDADAGTGAGLGLAIGDAVVRSTLGRWTVADSELGGAQMTVTWPRPHANRPRRRLLRPAQRGHAPLAR
jgi:signal transduction histidine kinase